MITANTLRDEQPQFFYAKPEKKFEPYGPQILIWRLSVWFIFTCISLVFLICLWWGSLLSLEFFGIGNQQQLLTVNKICPVVGIILAIIIGWLFSRSAIIITEPYYLATLLFASKKRVRKSGYRVLVPVFERIVTYIDTRSKPIAITDTTALTTDLAAMRTDVNLRVGVDLQYPEIAVWAVDNFVGAVIKEAETTVLRFIEESDMEALRHKEAKAKAASTLLAHMTEEQKSIGARIESAKTSDFVIADDKIRQAVTQVLEAKYLAEAKVILAEAESTTMQKLFDSLRAVLPEGTDQDTLARALMFLRQQQTLTQIASQSGFVPLADFGQTLTNGGLFEGTRGKEVKGKR
ncbi:hypothetical protein A2Z33_00360 [Candidatus Gottesmanbacteria bacterium RBG_16_52_11]|uniref:Band 7 domain-containing protein n=1 Tax=Candidatus Gottesmanbacteria bacterium RBG_16_52_11 TaxID=1798374 RepID=A0A1F5YNL9_9BACT|nr:MAG: hypothetical protein A2Z33_00360 [Candidatus Gottesmanbacteria bacterium RBG_16_52_11]